MSFLATDGSDDGATLSALLEVVDAWTPGLSTAPDIHLSAEPPTSGVSRGGKSRKRTRNPEADARRRLKKKKERQALVELAHELEDRCEHLRQTEQRRHHHCCSSTPVTARPVSSRCVELDDLLATALSDNRLLKAETTRNTLLIRVLHDAVSIPKGEAEMAAQTVDAAMEVHRSTLQRMHADLGTVFASFPALSPSRPFFLRRDTTFDAVGTPRIELSASLYLPWDVRRTSSVFADAVAPFSPCDDSVSACLEAPAESAEKGYSLGLCAPNASPGLQSVGLVQKRQRDGSMVLMWSSLVVHPTTGMAFVGRARIRIRSLSSELSLVEAFTDVSSSTQWLGDPHYGGVDRDTASCVQTALVGAFGDRVCAKHKAFLKRMLDVSGRSHLAATLAL